ncbi:MAG TPA: patatin-like phospholipase family protein [Longimicrobiales bacterium]
MLSGGGAKGLAHVGVIRVLDSLNIHPDLVVGTSMGALVGAMYAGGMSGRQIDSVLRRVPLGEIFQRERSRVVPRLGGLVEPVEALDPLLVWERRQRSLQLRGTVVREDAANALLSRLELRGNLLAGGDFDRLPIPFRAVATDLRNRRTVVLGSGDLARAVRASAAIPGVFTPVLMDGRPLVDGGISQNLPVAPARWLGARRIIASDVIERPGDEMNTGSPVAVLDQLLDLLLQQPDDTLAAADVRIEPSLAGMGVLDFTPEATARSIAAGYTAAARALASFRPEPDSGTCQSATGRPPQRTPPDSATLADISARLEAIQGTRAYQAIWLNPHWLGDSLALSPVGEPTPAGRILLGLGYDNQHGGHVSAGVENVSIFDDLARFGAMVYAGDLRRAIVARVSGVRTRLPALTPAGTELLPDPRTGRPPWGEVPGITVRPTLVLHAQEEELRHFNGAGDVTGTTTFRDLLAFAGAEVHTARGWYAAGGPVAQDWNGADSTWSPAPARSDALGGVVRLLWSPRAATVSDELAAGDGIALEAAWLTRYQRVLLTGAAPLRIGTVALRARAALGWGEHLPAGETFSLGGREGFPGLYAGELRGQRTASVALAGTRWVQGPVYARLELAAGSAQRDGMALPLHGWGTGASAGAVISTPLGGVTLSYGWSTFGHGAVFVQLGEP